MDLYGTVNNLFSGSWVFDYNYDDVSDVTIFGISSLDSDGDGISGVQLTDGAFAGYTLDFNGEVSFLAYVDNPFPTYATPIPGALWLLISGLVLLVGISKRKK